MEAPSPRLRADVELFRHTLLVHRFTIGEAFLTAQTLDESAFDRDRGAAFLRPYTWISSGRDPEKIKTNKNAILRDPRWGLRVRSDRRRMLERYRGTPFGELVARNSVRTVLASWMPYGRGSGGNPSRNTPATSSAPPRPPTQGGSSGGTGSGTGN